MFNVYSVRIASQKTNIPKKFLFSQFNRSIKQPEWALLSFLISLDVCPPQFVNCINGYYISIGEVVFQFEVVSASIPSIPNNGPRNVLLQSFVQRIKVGGCLCSSSTTINVAWSDQCFVDTALSFLFQQFWP